MSGVSFIQLKNPSPATSISEGTTAGAAEVIEAAGFHPNIRGETLGIEEFARIANEIVKRRGGKV